MSIEIGKIKESKRRARRAGAALSFTEKMCIVEQLREQNVVQLPGQKDDLAQKIESEDKNPKPLFLGLIRHTVEKQRRSREVAQGSDDEKQLIAEVQELFAQRERGLEALNVLFPEGTPVSIAFFDRLNDLRVRLGWGEISYRATCLLLLLAVEQLPVDSGEALLREIPRISTPDFFQVLESLPVLVAERELRPEFAAEWFPALVRRIGNDLASDGFWKALGAYCDRWPQSALKVLHCLSVAQSEEQIKVAAYILGEVRSLDLDEATLAQFKKLETEFLTSATAGMRSIYDRSWVQTAWRGKMQKTDLESLIARMSAGISDEREQVYWIVCRSLLSPSISNDCLSFGLGWLRANVSETIASSAKYNVIDFAARLPAARRKEAGELVLLVQPIPAEHKGIWQRMEYFLVSWLKTDLSGFSDFCAELARRNSRNWLEVLKVPRSFEWFFSELRGKDTGNLVAQLLFSTSADSRRIGFFFFDELDMNALPATILNTVGEDRVRVAFYELQRDPMSGHALARCLILLIPYVQRASLDFQEEFYNELTLQLENYRVVCREEFERKAGEFPILKKALDEVNGYFDALHRIQQSSINAMEVAGYRQARRLYERRFSNEVSKFSKESSIFIQLCKPVHLLYGKSWSTFHGGKLSETSGLQQFSSSIEIPRLEIIDPEGMALRRLYASTKIRQLSKSTQADEENA